MRSAMPTVRLCCLAESPSLLRTLTGAGAGIASSVRRTAGNLVPQFREGNLDDRDTDAMRELLPAMWLLASAWFRPDVRGLERVPRQGPVLIVGNHTGGANSPEVLISQLALSAYFGVERPHYQLAHRMVLNSPVGSLVRKFGTVEADPGNAEAALEAGAMVTVFPGGDYEVFRPSWESAKVDFGGRTGFLRLALRKNVPIVPMITLGGQEIALFLSRGERLAQLTGAARVLRLKTLPIVLGFPFGLSVGGFPPFVPLPAKVTMELLEPIDLRARYGEDPDVDEVYGDLMATMQRTLTSLQGERRLPVLG
jgi:1-acyl-sn-glycerol-3-phosphate acyltransferase